MAIKRDVMKFLVPVTINSLGRSGIGNRAVVPFYINPETFRIQESKQIADTMTKGGYMIQYWGEKLTTIQASGTTGSGGIEAIHILRDVYRNEIIQFNNILRERSANQQQDYITAFGSVGNRNRTANFGNGIRDIIDDLTQNAFSNIARGTSSIIEDIANSVKDFTSSNPTYVELVPTIGAFATNIFLYWQGETFQGYFTGFDYDENANSPGLFSYNFSFTITKRSGKRNNFMPWHRKPVDANGTPVSASMPREGAKPEELSFPITSNQLQITGYQPNPQDSTQSNSFSVTSTFDSNQSSQNDTNNVGVSRRGIIRGN